MFTGIIQALRPVSQVHRYGEILQIGISFPPSLSEGLELGASVSVNGVCLTVASFENGNPVFDLIPETQKKTTLCSLEEGTLVNIERAAKFGCEVGGHLVSGHVWSTALISAVEEGENHCVFTCQCDLNEIKYLFSKGFVSLDGVSLTVVDVNADEGVFTVHLIPETLQRTTLGLKKPNSLVNIEFDAQTQVIVDTLERLLAVKNSPA